MIHRSAALKEWASAVEAFLMGETILALRKGGIREETKDFELTSDAFFFFPTYEHQKEHLLKEAYRHYAVKTKETWDPEDRHVRIGAWAEVTEDILIEDEERLKVLSPYHIWTDDYAKERLRWKRTKPLHALLLRVYALEKPASINNVPEYSGCKSWLTLPMDGSTVMKRPVLSDAEYAEKINGIKRSLKNYFECG